MPTHPPTLNADQARALLALQSKASVFLTGGAGTGKSFLIQHYLRSIANVYPILASTGAAAILVGGRTFHSFFGLGIMEGGVEATVEKALKNKRLIQRLKSVSGIIIDEISMIPGVALRAAERIARKGRTSLEPWGGLRIIAVGDFSQLPPVTRFNEKRDWGFLDPVWEMSDFQPAVLDEVVRTREPEFLEVLNLIRVGKINEQVFEFLKAHTRPIPPEFQGTRMYPLRKTTEDFNLKRLGELQGTSKTFVTEYTGKAQSIEDLKRNAPVPEQLTLKDDALVMIRQNDPMGRWVNGSLGHVREMDSESLRIQLIGSKGTIEIEPVVFSLLDANGERVATAKNFPVTLAYATTIHKAQGATVDEMAVDLSNLWEPGQAYVALSRVRSAERLWIERWTPRSFILDPKVLEFYSNMRQNGRDAEAAN